MGIGRVGDGLDDADEFMAEDAIEVHVAFAELNVGGADAQKGWTDERFARGEGWLGVIGVEREGIVFEGEGEHENGLWVLSDE